MGVTETKTIKVSASYGGTINTGNYENIKLEYTVSSDCIYSDIEDALKDAHLKCKQMFDLKAAGIKPARQSTGPR